MSDSIKNKKASTELEVAKEQPAVVNVRDQEIVQELTKSYIDYAMSVIVARALPDVRDGLKPVQRRILYSMFETGNKPGTAFRKVAKIVGEIMGNYHPHGSAAIEDAMVRLAQSWNVRYMLVEGQGNFGNMDGYKHAAARYIEARLHKNSELLLSEIDKNTVDFTPNYDTTSKEPVVLPAIVPNLILNGGEGIAVGMATKVPPHNLGEVIDSMVAIVSQGVSRFTDENKNTINYENDLRRVEQLVDLPTNRFPIFDSEVEIKEILKYIKGPDFPTGGEIFDSSEISEVYLTGRGRILMRGISEIEEGKNGRYQIVITELPYQTSREKLIAKIAELVNNDKIKGISDIKNLSNREGTRIVVELKRDAKPKTIQNQLYKYTELQKAFNANMLALVDGEPQLLNIKQILIHFINYRQQVVIRQHEFELAKRREREHILEGLLIAIDNIDEVINTIRKSKDTETARTALMDKFNLTTIQAEAILDMQLRKLAALERQKLENEYAQIQKEIKEILNLLSDPNVSLKYILDQWQQVREKYADKRLTRINNGKADEINEEDLIAKEEVFVTISEQGYIKRLKNNVYQTQSRGGVGKKAMTTKEDDSVRHVFSCNTHDEILFFTNKGRVFVLRVYEVPEYSSRAAKGVPAINLVNLEQGELITSVLTRSSQGHIIDEDVAQEGENKSEKNGANYKYLFMATRYGVVKKTELSEFANVRSNGLIAIRLDDGDELIWVKPTTGENTLMLITRQAKSIHFHEKDVRETGRATRGVRGINLRKDDTVISMDVLRNLEDLLLTVSENGFGKVTQLSQFTLQRRGGSGIFAAQISKKTGNLVSARVLDHPNRELLIVSANGQAVRIPTNQLPNRNRQTMGVTLMRVKDGDHVAAIAVV